MTQGQFRLTQLQQKLDTQLGQHRDLELRVAQLEQPANVLSEAEKQGLVLPGPGTVTDVPQVQNPSSSVSAGHSGSPSAPSAGVSTAQAEADNSTKAQRSGGG